MKKVFSVMMLFIIVINSTTVSAQTFSNYLPGGKNYLNPDNVDVVDNVFQTRESIRVKPNQEYTLSFPGRDMIGGSVSILVEGISTYIDENPIGTLCVEVDDFVQCTFTTSSTEEAIDISISSEMMGLYFEHYGVEEFQLEEGNVKTIYEPYVAPYTDSSSPEFQGTGAYITSCDTVILIDEIISSHIVAYDEIEGDLSDQILIVSDAYTGHETTVGDYLVELSVSDSSGNTSYFDLYVMVKDEVAPSLNGPLDITTSYTEIVTIESIIAMFTVSDNYDTLSNDDIILVRDTYSGNSEIPGNYLVEFRVSDSSGNTTNHQVDITVIDDVAPIIYIDQYIVVVDVGSTFGIGDMIKMIRLSEGIESNEYDITVLEDEYTGNEMVEGEYLYKVRLNNEQGEELIREFKINVTGETKINDYSTQIVYSIIGVTIIAGAFLYKKMNKKLVR